LSDTAPVLPRPTPGPGPHPQARPRTRAPQAHEPTGTAASPPPASLSISFLWADQVRVRRVTLANRKSRTSVRSNGMGADRSAPSLGTDRATTSRDYH